MHSFTITAIFAGLAAANMATLHDYPSMADPAYANNPPFCEMPWASLDLSRITAWGLIDKSACGTCLQICGKDCGYFLVVDRSTDSAGHVDVSLAAGPAIFGDVTGRWPDAKVTPVDAGFCKGIWNGKMFDDATPAYGQLADLKAIQGGGLAQKAVSVPEYGAASTSVASAAAAYQSTTTLTVDVDECSTAAVIPSSAAVSSSSPAASTAPSWSSAAAPPATSSLASSVAVSSAAQSSISAAAAVPTTSSSSSASSSIPVTSASSAVKSTSSSLAYAAAASSVSHSTNTTKTTTTTVSSTITVSVTRLSTGVTSSLVPTGCLSAAVSAGTASAGLYCGRNSTATTYSWTAPKATTTKATFTGAAVIDRPAVLLVSILAVVAGVFAQL